MIKKHTYPFLILLVLASSFTLIQEKKVDEVKLITSKATFIAGDEIRLTFSSTYKSIPNLYFSNSYGSSVSLPTKKENLLTYDLTNDLNNKSGHVNWKLIFDKEKSIKGSFFIKPHAEISEIESYLGPNTIQAGEKDFAMMVLLLHDEYGNPPPDSTNAIFKSQFLDDISTAKVSSSNLICYKNFYTKNKAGRVLVTSESATTFSKEYTIDILPNVPANFTIEAKRDHSFADGNQLTEFSTSIIRDEFDNVVSDGTYVNFFIRNKNDDILKTSGVTIRGVAVGSIIHPDHPEQWKVKAYIPGMAESNEVNLEYKRAIKEFQLMFDKESSTLEVQGLMSFMNQFIPDGQRVELVLRKDKILINEFQETTRNGQAAFSLHDQLLSKGTYTFEVSVSGLTKKIHHINL